MKTQDDFKKEWEKARGQISRFGKEAVEFGKRWEKELVKFSHQSKLQLDAAAAGLKKERLYYLIGKEYAQGKKSNAQGPSQQLQNLLQELSVVEAEEKALKRRMKGAKKSRVV